MNCNGQLGDAVLDLSSTFDCLHSQAGVLTAPASNVILLDASYVTLPQTDKIAFHLTDSGLLVLANFIAERINDTIVFKPCDTTAFQSARNFNSEDHSNSSKADLPQTYSELSSKLVDTATSCTYICEKAPQHRDNSEITSDNNSDIMNRQVYQLLKKDKQLNANLSTTEIVIKGINLSKLKAFSDRLRRFRRRMCMSQSEMSQQISDSFSNELVFSQSLLCRFEKMHLSLRAAVNVQPYLQLWLDQAEVNSNQQGLLLDHSGQKLAVGKTRINAEARLGISKQNAKNAILSNSSSNSLSDLRDAPKLNTVDSCVIGNIVKKPLVNNSLMEPEVSLLNFDSSTVDGDAVLPSRRRRKKRTFFSIEAAQRLSTVFEQNPHPTRDEITQLASELDYERESVRIWFCNRRQLKISTTETAVYHHT